MSKVKSKSSNATSETVATHQEDPIVTYAEAARLLGRHRSTIKRWADDGLLTVYRHASGVPAIRMSQVAQLLQVSSN
jgi:excisionase family DNA binding protein